MRISAREALAEMALYQKDRQASGAEPRADGEDIQPRHEGLQNACYLPSIKKENYRPIRPLIYK